MEVFCATQRHQKNTKKTKNKKNETQTKVRMALLFHHLSRTRKQYASMLEEIDTWSHVFNQTFEALLKSAARLSELPTRWSKRFQGKRFIKSVLTIRLLLNSEQSQTDLRRIKRTSIQRQYYLASFSRATQVL